LPVATIADPVRSKEHYMPIAIIMLSLAAVSLAFSIYSIVRSVRERRMHQKQKQEYERRKALQEHLAGVWRMGPPTGEVGCPCKDARLLAAFADWSMSQNSIELAQLREIVDRINQAEIDNLSKGRDSINAIVDQVDARLSGKARNALHQNADDYIRAKKYVLHPGHVNSPDGARHFVGVVELCNLYKVSLANCLVDDGHGMRGIDTTDKIHLHPRSDGNYVHPEIAAKKV